ncbi:MAG: hypothetical protein V7637_2489 [Mycobacteriales bacterium]
MTSAYPGGESDIVPEVEAGRLWAGGLAVGLVAALIATAGVVIARGVFHVPVLAPRGDGTWGGVDTAKYAAAAALAALAATGVMHLLLFTPRPRRFFVWIMVLVTAVAALVPFSVGVGAAAVATALINLTLGAAIGSLTSGVAAGAVKLRPATADPGQQPPPVPGQASW